MKHLVRLSFKVMMILISLVALSSCGKDSSPRGESEVEKIIEKEAIELKLTFQYVHPKNIWALGYSKSIMRYLDRPELSTLLDTEINKSDLKLLQCSGYSQASIREKKRFWVIFMASIAHAESSLNPRTTYREKDGTLSSGLLQIDVLSANRHSYIYTGYLFNQEDLFNPEYNLMAGLYVMKHQLEGGLNFERPDIVGRLFTNRSYYWSVLTLKREQIIKTFTYNSRSNLPFCNDVNL